jgi:energy-coupling factor transport system substrate-specific component
MAATVECAKLALAFLPNVEVVTLLLALYGYVFGPLGFAAAIVFVSIEPLIYGFNTWVVSYYLYWPLVSLVFMLLAKLKVKNRWILTLVAVILTAWFGVLTTLVDIGLLSGFFDNFAYRFAVYYARGAVFYALQVASNLVLFPLLFRTLSEKLRKLT